jgi:hypothetical protein
MLGVSSELTSTSLSVTHISEDDILCTISPAASGLCVCTLTLCVSWFCSLLSLAHFNSVIYYVMCVHGMETLKGFINGNRKSAGNATAASNFQRAVGVFAPASRAG